jgi:hypothetical protein
LKGIVTAALSALLLTGWACGERSFEADEFVEEANANGAPFVLGEPLTSTAGNEVYALRLEEEDAAQPGELEAGQEHGGGSLTLTEDADAAREEYARCEEAVSLLCYRAANVVVAFEDVLAPEERARIEAAIRAMATE